MTASFGILAMLASSVSGVSVTPLNERTVTVTTRDLDLSKADHLRRLDGRIARAVGAVCSPYATRSAAAQQHYSECRTVARASARSGADRAIAAARAASPVALARK